MSFPNIDSKYKKIWESILPHCEMNNIFMTPDWQYIWWNRFAADKEVIIEPVQSGHNVSGIVTLLRKSNILTFIGNSDVFDYMDFPVVSGMEENFYRYLFNRLGAIEWNEILLESIPEGSPTLEFLPDIARKENYCVSVFESDVTPFLELPHHWDEYLSGLRKKDRHELRRKLRRLETQGDFRQFEVDFTTADVQSEMSEFFVLMAKSASYKEQFLTEDNKAVFVEIATKLSVNGQFRLFFMEIGSERVACCICFDYGNDIFLYNSGYNPEFSPLSIGLLNKALTIDVAISENKSEYNFLRGTERYKYHLGAEDRKVFDIKIGRKE